MISFVLACWQINSKTHLTCSCELNFATLHKSEETNNKIIVTAVLEDFSKFIPINMIQNYI